VMTLTNLLWKIGRVTSSGNSPNFLPQSLYIMHYIFCIKMGFIWIVGYHSQKYHQRLVVIFYPEHCEQSMWMFQAHTKRPCHVTHQLFATLYRRNTILSHLQISWFHNCLLLENIISFIRSFSVWFSFHQVTKG